MTTIVLRNNILAADTQSVDSITLLKNELQKLVVFDTAIVGFTGNVYVAQLFLDQFKKDMNKNRVSMTPQWLSMVGGDDDDAFEVIVMKEDKILLYDRHLAPVDISSYSYHALGSGEDIAYGALHMGATAVEAVKAAASRDSMTNSTVVSYSREDIPSVKRKRKQELRRKKAIKNV